MSRGPSERELDRLLAELPRVGASPSFRERVLAAIDRPPVWRRRRRLGLAVSTAAVAVLAVVLWLVPRPRESPPAAELEALRAEHRELVDELAALRASLRDSEAPVLYLGGTEELDLVLDLRPIWSAEGAGAMRPAVLGAGREALPAAAPRGERNGGEPR
jgi:hypothetical protein